MRYTIGLLKFVSINRLKLFSVNIALGKSAKQSTTYQVSSASRAVDGNTATAYVFGSCTHTSDSNGWWRVDFGKTARVYSVKITNRSKQ